MVKRMWSILSGCVKYQVGTSCLLYRTSLHIPPLNVVLATPLTRGGHSNRLCTNTRDRGQELGQAVKAENLEGQAVKGTSQIRKSQGSSTVKVNRIQNLIKALYHTLNSVKSKAYLSDGQAVKALIKVKFFDRAVAGVGTESIGVTSP